MLNRNDFFPPPGLKINISKIKARNYIPLAGLGLILVLSLVIWRLIELSLRQHLQQHQTNLPE
ncbi:MAG: hypothetical protein HQK58_06340 [Deltaproteobacteria bacterium]|nr:hypothetical protein [Deltaproteobacteria bacterium]